jgi:phosphoenolpyruvate carboxykinase (ATP)
MLHPTKYAAMLAEKMQTYGATGWLVNTGWSGGRYRAYPCVVPVRLQVPPSLIRYNQPTLHLSLFRYGVGNRIKLAYTRKIIDAIHSGELLTANYQKTEVFGLEIPTAIEGVPSEILDPTNTVSFLQHSPFTNPSIFCW